MRIPQRNLGAMLGQETVNPNAQIELDESSNSQQMPPSLAGYHKVVGGIAFNRVAADLEPHKNGRAPTEEEEEENSEKEEPPVAVAENVSQGRKKLLMTAEETLDGARVAAELVMKDAMDALQRTKQRLIEILLPHSSHAPPAADKSSETPSDALSPDEDKQQSTMLPSTQILKIFSEPTMGFVFPLEQQSTPPMAVGIISRL